MGKDVSGGDRTPDPQPSAAAGTLHRAGVASPRRKLVYGESRGPRLWPVGADDPELRRFRPEHAEPGDRGERDFPQPVLQGPVDGLVRGRDLRVSLHFSSGRETQEARDDTGGESSVVIGLSLFAIRHSPSRILVGSNHASISL